MNDKDILLDKGGEQDEIVRVSRRKVWSSLLAAVLCLALAGLVWVCVMNTQDTDYIPIRVVAPSDYECVLSVDGVEVEGSVATLKELNEIVITISPDDASYILYYYEGQASVNEAILQLPDGAHTAEGWSAVLTVRAK